MNKIINKIRYIKGIIFARTAFPSQFDAFYKTVKSFDKDSLSEIEKTWNAYKVIDKYVIYVYHTKLLKKVIYTFAFPFIYCVISHKKITDKIKKTDIIYYQISDNQGILPLKYKNNPNLIKVVMGEGMFLDEEARNILKESFKISKGNLCFLMEELLALANYSYICNKYNPNEIITTYESCYANSVLTLYCHKKNVIHTNFMHGEKLFSPLNVLGCFDTMYVWDEYYEVLFRQMKYSVKCYEIENPWEKVILPNPNCLIDYTFYMNYETKKTLTYTVKIARELQNKGYSVRIRLHPSQLKEKKLIAIVPPFMIDNGEKNILQSIANTNYCISRYSTVLYQAYLCRKHIIIDDITNEQEYKKLREQKYIMLNKEHLLLSKELIEKGVSY